MNDILKLKGRFQHREGMNRGGAATLPRGKDRETGAEPSVSAERLEGHAKQIRDLHDRWQGKQHISGALVDVHYKQVIAKSNRIRALFTNGEKESNDTIVGARFAPVPSGAHIVTHHVTIEMLTDAERMLLQAAAILRQEFGGKISPEDLEKIDDKKIKFTDYGISKSPFRQVVVDSYYVSRFEYPEKTKKPQESIITLYKTSDDMRAVLKSIGITVLENRMFNGATVQLHTTEVDTLFREAPYLIAMAVENMNTLVQDEKGHVVANGRATIASPGDEPVIGVIDTPFDAASVYFRNWVEYESLLDPEVDITPEDQRHGTAITSIIVDGPNINPHLDDGCGNFRVKHFGVARKGQMSSFEIMRNIEKIVKDNPAIRVWNLSLGSVREVAESYISPEAAMLDKLQQEHDVIFVVSGTNNLEGKKPGEKKIGSPADSINSIVVNAVNERGDPAIYSREGRVLSFFKKPDLSYFGGDNDAAVRVCTPLGEEFMVGTSLATPWITRKVAFMMEVLGLSREVTKALLIDAAAQWNDTGNNPKKAPLLGYGVVPTHINDIVKSNDNEIKFVIEGEAKDYDTYNYGLPVPTDNGKHPFTAKATLCYFPPCSISQGVDYTSTELDVYIGRMKKEGKSAGLKPIDKNVQSLEDGVSHWVDEKTARSIFRKWDNSKHIREVINDKFVPRKAYEDGLWGVSIKKKNRTKVNKILRFGLVVTLREMDGVNRINDFIQRCSLRGWLVDRIDVESSLEVYAKSQEILEL